jgi:hypothetical protein
LEAIELRDGEIFVAGRTLPFSPAELARRERQTQLDEDREVDNSGDSNSASQADQASGDDQALGDPALGDPAMPETGNEDDGELMPRPAAQVGSAAKENRQR